MIAQCETEGGVVTACESRAGATDVPFIAPSAGRPVPGLLDRQPPHSPPSALTQAPRMVLT
jgi:hypothetical protein